MDRPLVTSNKIQLKRFHNNVKIKEKQNETEVPAEEIERRKPFPYIHVRETIRLSIVSYKGRICRKTDI
jgi:hypothetical protein